MLISQQDCFKGSHLENSFQPLSWGRRGKGWGRGDPTAPWAHPAPAASVLLPAAPQPLAPACGKPCCLLTVIAESCLRHRSQPKLSLVLDTGSPENLLFPDLVANSEQRRAVWEANASVLPPYRRYSREEMAKAPSPLLFAISHTKDLETTMPEGVLWGRMQAQ